MAITVSNLTASGNSLSTSTYTTASVTPAGGGVVLASLNAYDDINGINVPTPAISGLGLTWSLVNKVDIDAAGTDRETQFLWVGTGTPTSGAITFTWDISIHKCNWCVGEAVGASGTIPQSVVAVGSSTTPAVALGAIGANSVTYAVIGGDTSTSVTFSSNAGWTTLGTAIATSFCSDWSQYSSTGDLNAGGTLSGSGPWGIIAAELAAAGSAGVGDVTGTVTWAGDAQGPISLPGDISDTTDGTPVEPESGSHNPPFMDSNGNLYKMMEGPQNAPEPPGPLKPCMMKSSDGGMTWAEADSANAPNLSSSDQEGNWSLQVGTSIYYSNEQNPSNPRFMRFNTSDATVDPDRWVDPATGTLPINTEHVSDAGTSESSVGQWCAFNFLSDGSAWFWWAANLSGAGQQISYAKRTVSGGSASYTAATSGAFDVNASVSNPMPVTDGNDLTWVFYTDNTNQQLVYRTMTAAGTLSGVNVVYNGGIYSFSTDYCRGEFTNAVHWNDGVHDYVGVGYADFNGFLHLALFTDGAMTTESISSEVIAGGGGASTSETITAHLALDGTDVHIAWVDNTTGEIRYRARSNDGTYNTEAVIWEPPGGTPPAGATTAPYVYNNVYTTPDGAKIMGFTFDRGIHLNSVSYVQYNEIVLSSGAPPAPQLVNVGLVKNPSIKVLRT